MKKKVVKNEPKNVTMSAFEKAMASIANSFNRMDQRFDKFEQKLNQHDKAFTLVLKQMQTSTEEAREHRQAMSSLMRTDVNQERNIEELRIRIERLEMQIK